MTITELTAQARTAYADLMRSKDAATTKEGAGDLLEEAGVQDVIAQHLDALGEDPTPEALVDKAREFEGDALENRYDYADMPEYQKAAAQLEAYAARLREMAA